MYAKRTNSVDTRHLFPTSSSSLRHRKVKSIIKQYLWATPIFDKIINKHTSGPQQNCIFYDNMKMHQADMSTLHSQFTVKKAIFACR